MLNNIVALFTNPTFLWGYVHVILASLVTGALIMLAVSAWHLRKDREVEAFNRTASISVVVLLPAILLAMFVGSELGVDRGQVPADEDRRGRGAVEQLPALLVLAVPDRRRQQRPDADADHLEIPHLLSLLATNSWNGAGRRG